MIVAAKRRSMAAAECALEFERALQGCLSAQRVRSRAPAQPVRALVSEVLSGKKEAKVLPPLDQPTASVLAHTDGVFEGRFEAGVAVGVIAAAPARRPRKREPC